MCTVVATVALPDGATADLLMALLKKKRGTLRQEYPAMMEAQGIEPWSE
jgi:hypothetical protein